MQSCRYLGLMGLAIAALAILLQPMQADAQSGRLLTLALKSGESIDAQDLYYVANCKSLINGPILAEILDGPPEVTVSVREKRVLPRAQGCARYVKGAALVLTAKEIEDPSSTKITIRLTFPTRDIDRKVAVEYNLSLIP